ncbi:MAG: hypothetical protein H6739_19935 [Alphaproteobacteria bacterium]|nr:hypothetical protein [Alphaproteobacteria bacterium]
MNRNIFRMLVLGLTLLALWVIPSGRGLLPQVAASDDVPDLQECESQFETCKAAADDKKEKKKCKKKQKRCTCTYVCAERMAGGIDRQCETMAQRNAERDCGSVSPSDIPPECGHFEDCYNDPDPACERNLYDCAVAWCVREAASRCVAEETQDCIDECMLEE